MTFEEWMKEVNQEILNRTMGAISYNDLDDWHYRDAYDDGVSPAEAAEEALENDDMASMFL